MPILMLVLLSPVAGLGLAGLGWWRAASWVASGWDDSARVAAIGSAVTGTMLIGFAILRLSGVPPLSLDFTGKVVLNILAVAVFASQVRRSLRQETRPDGRQNRL
jgi:hypothetical protein